MVSSPPQDTESSSHPSTLPAASLHISTPHPDRPHTPDRNRSRIILRHAARIRAVPHVVFPIQRHLRHPVPTRPQINPQCPPFLHRVALAQIRISQPMPIRILRRQQLQSRLILLNLALKRLRRILIQIHVRVCMISHRFRPAHNFNASAASAFPSNFLAFTNPYAAGTCRFCNTARVFRVISTRVKPGDRCPFSGRSSNVIATFCAPHAPAAITRKTHAGRNPRITRMKYFIPKVYKAAASQLFTLC